MNGKKAKRIRREAAYTVGRPVTEATQYNDQHMRDGIGQVHLAARTVRPFTCRARIQSIKKGIKKEKTP